jgi:Flp pilus assembly pilin Flp
MTMFFSAVTRRWLVSRLKSQAGAETVEYALVVGLFAIAAAVGLMVANGGIGAIFTAINNVLLDHLPTSL